MFIYSIRASTIKFFGFIALTLAVLIAVVMIGGGDTVMASGNGEIDYSGIKKQSDRIAFIESFGIKVDAESEEEVAFTMPESFDRVILGYNELQKKQGLDLSKYAKKRVTRYSYKITNYDYPSDTYATLFVYRGRVVACDVSSADPEGFVTPLTLVDRTKLK